MTDFTYVIPQFIDVEARVIGPVTVRQFITLVVAFVIVAIEYAMFDMSLFLVLAFFTLGGAGILAFFKVNGAPFHIFVLNIVSVLRHPAIRVWRKEPKDFVIVKELASALPEEQKIPRKVFSTSRLGELTLIVNTGGMYKEEEQAYWRGEITQ